MILAIFVWLLFWLAFGAMLHTYFIYPFTLRYFKRRYSPPRGFKEGEWPTVALLIPAYNEEAVIGRKIDNCLALDYDPAKLEILIGSDGSTDKTSEIVRSFTVPRLKFFEFRGRKGKPGILNRLVQETKADILVMTDANVKIEPTTFSAVIRHFADPDVAGVATVKRITNREASDVSAAEDAYALHMSHLKELEAAVGGFSGAVGAYYAMRREWFHPFPLVAMNDDIVSLYPAVLAGKRVAFEPRAIGWEDGGSSVEMEFKRRTRIGASNFKTLELCRKLVHPSRGIVAYTFVSHKVLRWTFPFLMIVAFYSNLAVLHTRVGQLLFAGQVIAYAIALIGLVGSKWSLANRLYYFVAMNAALFVGWFAYKFGTRTAVWEPTERAPVKNESEDENEEG